MGEQQEFKDDFNKSLNLLLNILKNNRFLKTHIHSVARDKLRILQTEVLSEYSIKLEKESMISQLIEKLISNGFSIDEIITFSKMSSNSTPIPIVNKVNLTHSDISSLHQLSVFKKALKKLNLDELRNVAIIFKNQIDSGHV
ncbi:hypothetical protein [Photobacterium leiognathi]|uniref:hypothetical protein n=1 Tax=Photobacterium leiognathi TaxID=553611 RepID=UPI0029820566|nr:hypothetical protein [Photobacterium leiognathi]